MNEDSERHREWESDENWKGTKRLEKSAEENTYCWWLTPHPPQEMLPGYGGRRSGYLLDPGACLPLPSLPKLPYLKVWIHWFTVNVLLSSSYALVLG